METQLVRRVMFKLLQQRYIENLNSIVAEFVRTQTGYAGEASLNFHEFSYETRCGPSQFIILHVWRIC